MACKYPKENISDTCYLYRHITKESLKRSKGKIPPGAFKNSKEGNGGMSTDWAKYSCPKQSLKRHPKDKRGRIVKLKVGNIRSLPNQIVEHTPTNKNRSHSDVFGDKDTEIRTRLKNMSDWV